MLASDVEGLGTGHVTALKHKGIVADGGHHLPEGAGVRILARPGEGLDPLAGEGRHLREGGHTLGPRLRRGRQEEAGDPTLVLPLPEGGPRLRRGIGLHLRQPNVPVAVLQGLRASVLVHGKPARTGALPPNHRRGRKGSPAPVLLPLRMMGPHVKNRGTLQSWKTEKPLPPLKTEKLVRAD